MRYSAVVTDLDGTLLDHGGVFGPDAAAAVAQLRSRGIPVVPLTSKTADELRTFLDELDAGGIGSFENGAGVLRPDGVDLVPGALPVEALAERLDELATRTGLPLRPVSRLSVEEIVSITGLPRGRVPAMLARGHGLPFLAPEGAEPGMRRALEKTPGLRLTRGGLFWHLSGDHGKEDALLLMLRTGLLARPVAGFGDAPNDAGFLAHCDLAVLVPGPSGEVDPSLRQELPAARIAPHPAGRGWAAAARKLLGESS